MNVLHFAQKKQRQEKILMVTCYDHWSASLLEETGVDAVLVGDSLGMVMHGHPTTLPVETSTMALHVAAVRRGLKSKFIVADMPFLSFRKSLETNMENAESLMKAGAEAVKIEGARGNLELVRHLVDSGVPVMGHLGLTPQSVHQLGGFRVQGREVVAQDRLRSDARALQEAGCFSLVLECVPQKLGAEISKDLTIPTIGIGAGGDCDGQILVLHDLLGLTPGPAPRFVRRYLNGAELFQSAISQFCRDVKEGQFPNESEVYE